MNPKTAAPSSSALDKLSRAETPDRVRQRSVSRRRWLGVTLGGAAAAAEAASLAGTWDHRKPSSRAPTPGSETGSGSAPAPGSARLLHVGHCCHLVEIDGQRWLTDPWFYNPAFGALSHESALAADAVGPLDGIFISHRHPDHFDPSALRLLDRRSQVWTADESLVGPLRELGFGSVALSQPWQTLQHGSLAVSFVPAVHDVPQHSLVLAGRDARLLFCADTGFHEHWAEIRSRYQPLTALLPCDGTRLRWEERLIMTPEEAARAAAALGCPQVLQTHADATYTDPLARYLLSETEAAPLPRLSRALGQLVAQPAPASGSGPAPANGARFQPLRVGETRALASATSTTI